MRCAPSMTEQFEDLRRLVHFDRCSDLMSRPRSSRVAAQLPRGGAPVAVTLDLSALCDVCGLGEEHGCGFPCSSCGAVEETSSLRIVSCRSRPVASRIIRPGSRLRSHADLPFGGRTGSAGHDRTSECCCARVTAAIGGFARWICGEPLMPAAPSCSILAEARYLKLVPVQEGFCVVAARTMKDLV